MVEIFRTDVDEHAAPKLIGQLSEHCPDSRINFDLEDCDKILRIEAKSIPAAKIVELLRLQGFQCEILD